MSLAAGMYELRGRCAGKLHVGLLGAKGVLEILALRQRKNWFSAIVYAQTKIQISELHAALGTQMCSKTRLCGFDGTVICIL